MYDPPLEVLFPRQQRLFHGEGKGIREHIAGGAGTPAPALHLLLKPEAEGVASLSLHVWISTENIQSYSAHQAWSAL